MRKLLFLAIVSSMLAACSEKTDEPVEPGTGTETETPAEEEFVGETIELNAYELQALSRENSFATRLFNNAIAFSPEGNMMLSPLSIASTLAMKANIVGDDARAEILTVLGFDSSELDSLNIINSRLAAQLPRVDPDVCTSLANSIWVDNSLAYNTAYVNGLQKAYKADIFNENLANATAKVNAWASEKTNGMIKEFINEIPCETKLILLNALYFTGGWTNKFDVENTVKAKFHNADGTESTVDMMSSITASAKYKKDSGAAWLRLPFGNRNFSITFILPDGDINSCLAGVSEENFSDFIHYSDMQYVDIYLPRLSFEFFEDRISDILEQMGIKNSFKLSSEFTSDHTSTFQSTILHKTKFEMDEEGAKAAGVTGDMLIGAAGPDAEPLKNPEFRADRPFGFIIAEENTGAILFMGRVANL